METETKAYQPRIVRRTELWVPHNEGEIAFASPSHGPNFYQNVGSQILNSNKKVPTGDHTASLLHASYCSSVRGEPEFADVRKIMKYSWLWVYNRNLWTDKGVYIIQDKNADGRNKPLNISDLEKILKDGRELSHGGIRFSQDGKVRFAPKGSYVLGEHTSESLAKDGFIIASYEEEGATKFEEVSTVFRNKPYIYGLEIQTGQSPALRVSAVCDGGGRLGFDGDDFGDDDGHAFGVWK